MKLSGVILGTADSKKLAEFYTKILGEPGWHDGDWYGFGEKEFNIVIGPHSEVSGQSAQPQRMMISFAADDVKAEFERLVSAGAVVVAKPYQPEMANDAKTWLATLADPDGNYLQLMSPWED